MVRYSTKCDCNRLSDAHFLIRQGEDAPYRRHHEARGPDCVVSFGVCVSLRVNLSPGQSVFVSLVCPTTVLMSRCLALARFVLGSSRGTGTRLTTCTRGLSSRTASRSLSAGELMFVSIVSRVSWAEPQGEIQGEMWNVHAGSSPLWARCVSPTRARHVQGDLNQQCT